METPQELEVWYVLPALRKRFAEIMIKNGLKQKEIAARLGLRKSAVSQYLKSQRGTELKLSKELDKAIENSVKKILKHKSCVMKELQNICKLIRKKGLLCKFHKSKNKKIQRCGVCYP